MAKKQATVVTFPQLQEVVDNLKKKYSVALGDVEPAQILYLKSDAEPKRGPKVARLSPIKVPHPSVTIFRFALTVFAQYDEIDEARQVLHILRELRRIEDFERGKMGNCPLQDFPEIVEKYGTTWEDRDDLDNPLEEKEAEE